MSKQSSKKLWLLWSAASVILIFVFMYVLMQEGISKTVFMPGELSSGHHQLADSCESCHSSPFGGGEVILQACIDCHGDDRVKPQDSHPRSKFKDPRNADRLAKINALDCTSCHVEHRPEITLKDGLTQPLDVCFHCHAEVADERPSHAGMEFSTCKDSGCHNFHNNRALYTDFLTKHMDDPHHLPKPHLPSKEFIDVVEEIIEYPHDHYPIQTLAISDIDAPQEISFTDNIERDWLETAHAKAGVNCSGCHQQRNDAGELLAWQNKPGIESCQTCHTSEFKRFTQGKHGMRIAAGLSPMSPKDARLPMQESAAHSELTCISCHGAHQFDVKTAAVDSCLECHADEHSLAYKKSKHFSLWQTELTNPENENTGVSCASCHMPRIDFDVSDWVSRKLVDHNQSANLSPNSKMIRSACMHCHGLGFSIDALADQALININFSGMPSVKVESIDLARKDLERYLREKEQATSH